MGSKKAPNVHQIYIPEQGRPQEAKGAFKRLQEGPKRAPRGPRRAPKRVPRGPQRHPRGPKRHQEAPKVR